MAELSEMDRNQLPDIIENLVRDTPRTSVSVARMRRILEKIADCPPSRGQLSPFHAAGNLHHATINLQHSYEAPVERVFSEIADPATRAK